MKDRRRGKTERETLGDPQGHLGFASPAGICAVLWPYAHSNEDLVERTTEETFFYFKKRTSVKYPVLHFYGTKSYLFFFLFPTSVIVSFVFAGVL